MFVLKMSENPADNDSGLSSATRMSASAQLHDPPLYLQQDWKLQMLDPSVVSRFKDRLMQNQEEIVSFSDIPWVLHQANGNSENVVYGKDRSSCSAAVSSLSDVPNQKSAHYPNVHFLDLRRLQNIHWADHRLREGVALATTQPQTHDLYSKAVSAYRQGLELVPDHVDLLVALGALHANHGKHVDALRHLQKAVELDPMHANANIYLKEVQAAILRRKKSPQKASGPSVKAVRATLDASLERSMMAVGGAGAPSATAIEAHQHVTSSYNDQYPLLDDEDESSRYRRDKKRSKHGKKKSKKDKELKKRKRKRKRRHSSDDTASSSSSIDSEDRHRRSHKHRKRKRRRARDDDVSLSLAPEQEEIQIGDRSLTADTESHALSALLVDRVPRLANGDDNTATHRDLDRRQARAVDDYDSSSSVKSASTRDSLQLGRANKLRRLVDRHDLHAERISVPNGEPAS